ncbi:MAG: NAD(+) synthase [Dehalococcoidales bacterium]|nr:NAD(+) synthase [Dehalococcoidales bacterium]
MDTEKLDDKLVSWIKDKVTAAGLNGAVFGMSGGVDSSVIAVLCYKAFKDNALGLVMPCHSIGQDEQHAISVANKFTIQTKTIVLDNTYDILVQTLSSSMDNPLNRLTLANIKARLRMITLYFYANQLGYMVIGSGNKSELATGYFTKYGDSGVDILPLGNLVKAQVRDLAIVLGISGEIIAKPPSAGLWQGQTDEGEMGLTYNELDDYLTIGKATDTIKHKIESMLSSSSHKRLTPPIPDF